MQPAPGPESSRRRLLGFSVGLNVLCVFLLVLVIHRSGKVADPAPVPGVKPPAAVAPPMRTPPPVRPLRDAQTVPSEPTPWSRLVSADLREYARNLSQAGCPAETVCDILVPESERILRIRKLAPDRPTEFWLAGGALAARHRELKIKKAQMQRDHLELLSELACRDFGRSFRVEEELLVGVAAGFLSPERRAALVDLLWGLNRSAEEWRERTEGVTLPEDLRFLEGESARFSAGLGNVVTTAELEEIILRVTSIIGLGFHSDIDLEAAAAIRVTPAEFRELNRRAYAAGENELTLFFDFQQRMLDEHPQRPQRPDAVRDAEYRDVLGTARAEEFRLRVSPGYDARMEWVEKFGADPGTPRRIQLGLDQFEQEIAALAARGRDQPETVKEEVRAAFASALGRLEQGLEQVAVTNRTKLLSDWLRRAAQTGWSSP